MGLLSTLVSAGIPSGTRLLFLGHLNHQHAVTLDGLEVAGLRWHGNMSSAHYSTYLCINWLLQQVQSVCGSYPKRFIPIE